MFRFRNLRRPSIGDYSAIVKVQETNVWAEDEYGKTIADGQAGVDDASVIQSALDVGEYIVLNGNTFTITTPLKVSSKHYIEGISKNVELVASSDINIFEPKDSTSYTWYVTIKKLSLLGYSKTGTGVGIKMVNAQHWLIEEVNIDRFDTGILIDGADKGSYVNEIRKCDLRYKGYGCGTGIKFTAGTEGASANIVYGGRIGLCDIGIDIDGGGTNWIVSPNMSDNTVHIRVNTDFNWLITPRIEGGTTGIELTASSSRCFIIFPGLTNLTTEISYAGSNHVILSESADVEFNKLWGILELSGNPAKLKLNNTSYDRIDLLADFNFTDTFIIKNVTQNKTFISFDRYGRPRFPSVKTFTTAPTLADMYSGELAIGLGTGPTGEDELFYKTPDGTKILRFYADGVIT